MASAAATVSRDVRIPPPSSARARLSLAASDIKLAHSVFALPFAILGAFLARDPALGWPRFGGQLLLIVVCMFFARTWAMLVNRLADRRYDAANPRTQRRAVAAHPTLATDFFVLAGLCAAAFIAAAGAFWVFFDNPWPLLLSAPVLAWIALYSFTKRFTSLCHVFLGGALAVSPLAAAIAVRPEALAETPALFWIAGMVLAWVAGFDVIYALQDIDFDRRTGLCSIPARLGWRRAAWVSRALHAAAAACLALAWRADPRLGWIFGAGVALVGVLLVLEHAVLARRGKAGLDMAFFTVNGIVSCVLGAVGVIDLLA